MKVLLTEAAEADLDAAAAFYEDQELGLGDEVISFLQSEVQQLGQTAGIHRRVRAFHRCVVQGRFPYYVIYYRLQDDQVIVDAVLDHRRNPRLIRRTLRQRS